MRTRLGSLLLAAAALVACLAPLAARAQVLEHEVKAAYLYRFLGFVEWPAGAGARPEAPIAIGVLGADDVASELQEIVAGRTVLGRSVVVRRVREGDPVNGLQVLYVGRAAAAALARFAQAPGLLVVADGEAALDQGAVIAFVRSDDRIRFHVALDHAQRRGLRISSRMLAVAEQVRGGRL